MQQNHAKYNRLLIRVFLSFLSVLNLSCRDVTLEEQVGEFSEQSVYHEISLTLRIESYSSSSNSSEENPSSTYYGYKAVSKLRYGGENGTPFIAPADWIIQYQGSDMTFAYDSASQDPIYSQEQTFINGTSTLENSRFSIVGSDGIDRNESVSATSIYSFSSEPETYVSSTDLNFTVTSSNISENSSIEIYQWMLIDSSFTESTTGNSPLSLTSSTSNGLATISIPASSLDFMSSTRTLYLVIRDESAYSDSKGVKNSVIQIPFIVTLTSS